jgi:hypothetical protein
MRVWCCRCQCAPFACVRALNGAPCELGEQFLVAIERLSQYILSRSATPPCDTILAGGVATAMVKGQATRKGAARRVLGKLRAASQARRLHPIIARGQLVAGRAVRKDFACVVAEGCL